MDLVRWIWVILIVSLHHAELCVVEGRPSYIYHTGRAGQALPHPLSVGAVTLSVGAPFSSCAGLAATKPDGA